MKIGTGSEGLQPLQVAAYLSLGSNLGQRGENLDQALQLLRRHPAVQGSQCSAIYQTKPYGPVEQDAFWNFCLRLDLDEAKLLDLSHNACGNEGQSNGRQRELCAHALLQYCLDCELQLGRDRSAQIVHWGPRSIDIDLIDYEYIKVDSPHLHLPHPHFLQRLFVLVPLAEIADEKLLRAYSLKEQIQRLKVLPENRDWGFRLSAGLRRD